MEPGSCWAILHGGKAQLSFVLQEIIPFYCTSAHTLGGLSGCCKDLGASAGARIKSSGIFQTHCGPESTQKELLPTKNHKSSCP